ncbi:MAG: GntR family transcriptional regulator [Chitinivibrionales bacterium]|nr:GntR family transcriptional regulator [Chitinivibrionales bacterium]
MQEPTRSPALARATAFLYESLYTVWREGERLPTATELASMAGVSRGTMVKAVRQLVDEGKLTAVRRRGIIAGASPVGTAGRRSSRALQKWERLKHRIEYDLYDGHFHKARELPAAKQLQAHYGVDFRTLKKALAALADDRVLRVRKRSYEVVRAEENFAENAVAYVSARELYRTPYRNFPEPGDLIRQLESECGRRKLQFRPLSTNDVETFKRAIHDYRTLGGLFYHTEQYSREVLDEFTALRKPVSIFDNYNHAQRKLPQTYLQRNRIRVFQFDEIYAGNEVGRFLLRLGHRKVVFISPFHSDWVYPIRYESLREVFENAGGYNTVELVAANNIRHSLQQRATQLLEQRRQRRLQDGPERDMYRELEELGLREGSDEILINWATSSPTWNIAPEHVYNAVLHRELQPLFERARALQDVSAWVCANDGIAIHALRWLHACDVAVPGEISVLGFDNTGDASYNDLTSYDFDVASIALKMLDHILRPESSVFASSQRIINSEGMVIPRGSARKTG